MSTIILRKIERISSAFLELLMRRNMMMWLNGVNMWRFSCGEIPLDSTLKCNALKLDSITLLS